MKLQKATDFAAIGLSVLCIVHCLVLPLTFVLFPAFTLAAMTSESFHLWILLGILPLSVIALSVGYKHHRDIKVLQISLPGLLLVMSAPLFENVTLGEYLEVMKMSTHDPLARQQSCADREECALFTLK